ncbi:MAG: DUF6206 family protein [Bacteroidota bacterium]
MEPKVQNELERLLVGQSNREPLSQLGFFSKPVAIEEGPLSGNVIKVYRSSSNSKLLIDLQEDHQAYLQALDSLGVSVPPTHLHVVSRRKSFTPIIVQKRLGSEAMIRYQLEQATDIDTFISLTQRLLQAAIDFIITKHEQDLHVGFHPTTRNYALDQHNPIYFDTFPPMTRGQEAVNRYILHFAPVPCWVKYFIRLSALNRISDEYYDDVKMLIGIVGSACRLRPAGAEQILSAGRRYIEESSLREPVKQQVSSVLAEPPRLSRLWTSFRRVFRKEGAPNTPR